MISRSSSNWGAELTRTRESRLVGLDVVELFDLCRRELETQRLGQDLSAYFAAVFDHRDAHLNIALQLRDFPAANHGEGVRRLVQHPRQRDWESSVNGRLGADRDVGNHQP